jgi:hypothetical protein
MDINKFNLFFDTDKRLVKEHEFRKAIFKGLFIHNGLSMFLNLIILGTILRHTFKSI